MEDSLESLKGHSKKERKASWHTQTGNPLQSFRPLQNFLHLKQNNDFM